MLLIAVYVLMCVLCFGTWPVMGRFSGLPAPWILLTCTGGTFVVAFVSNAAQLTPVPTRAVFIGMFCGLLNGLGMIFYVKLIGAREFEVSRILPVVSALMPSIHAVSALILLREPLTMRKGGGIAAITVGIYLLATR